MATVRSTVKGFEQLPGEDSLVNLRRTQKILEKMQAASNALPAGVIVGGMIRFGVADGYAHYLVTKDRPLTLAHVPFCDAYQAHSILIRGLRVADVQLMLKQAQGWRKLMATSKPMVVK